jgi:hypothetical protein
MVFGALIIIFSLFYFGRYAKINFNKMIKENEINKNFIIIAENDSLSSRESNILINSFSDNL